MRVADGRWEARDDDCCSDACLLGSGGCNCLEEAASVLGAAERDKGKSAAWETAGKLCCGPDKVVDLGWLSMSLVGSGLPKGDLFPCSMLAASEESAQACRNFIHAVAAAANHLPARVLLIASAAFLDWKTANLAEC